MYLYSKLFLCYNDKKFMTRACLPFVFAMKNEKNRPFFKEKSAVDIEISTRILTMKNKI